MAGKSALPLGLLALAGVSSVFVTYARHSIGPVSVPTEFHDAEPAALPDADVADADKGDKAQPDEPDLTFSVPSGRPASLSCEQARLITQQLRNNLAYAPGSVPPSTLATSTADWLDPYGLWSEVPDSPVAAMLERRGPGLVKDVEGDSASGCPDSMAVGKALADWVEELGERFDEGRRKGDLSDTDPSKAAGDALLDVDPPLDGRALARALGERAGAFEHGLGAEGTAYADVARERFLPKLSAEEWGRVVLAAEVRAYVGLLDPHAAWAPRDEEASVYDLDLDAHPPDRMWGRAARTAVGVRVEDDPLEPLQLGDIVLSIRGVPTAGLPNEQLEQLVYATTDDPLAATLVVLRPGEKRTRTLELPAIPDAPAANDAPGGLPAYRAPYGTGDALVVAVHDIVTDLADQLEATLARARATDTRPLVGLLLDLRDDGGGSTDGAISALGMFLPGAPLFPMGRRDGAIEVDRAPEPPPSERWTKPVAALVDGDTASAAEMIAGALAAYRRGPVVGWPTYGKGCAQEYMDDAAATGVLRLTTLLYCLPDGTPVQGVGVTPQILLPGAPPSRREGTTHEADEPNAAPTWRGPDVRDLSRVPPADSVAWPDPGSVVGPCRDAVVCRALRAVGTRKGGLAKATPLRAPLTPH